MYRPLELGIDPIRLILKAAYTSPFGTDSFSGRGGGGGEGGEGL